MARRETAARRYAEACFEIGTRDDTVEVWRRELDMAGTMVVEQGLEGILANPAIPLERRYELAAETFGKTVGQPTLNLVRLLIRRGMIDQLPRVAAEFGRLDDIRQGITQATATSALPLAVLPRTPDEVRAITERLEQTTGGRVELASAVDPSLLGGVIVRVGDRLIDGSVRGRLERLRNQLVSGAL